MQKVKGADDGKVRGKLLTKMWHDTSAPVAEEHALMGAKLAAVGSEELDILHSTATYISIDDLVSSSGCSWRQRAAAPRHLNRHTAIASTGQQPDKRLPLTKERGPDWPSENRILVDAALLLP